MDVKQKNRRTTRYLVLVAVGMFGFGFALWPLYTVLCEVTGLGGRAIQISDSNSEAVASDRVVSIRFGKKHVRFTIRGFGKAKRSLYLA